MMEVFSSAASLHSIKNNGHSSASLTALFPSRQRRPIPSLALRTRAVLLLCVAAVSVACFPAVGQTLCFNALSARREYERYGVM